jgi:hypothetical protein
MKRTLEKRQAILDAAAALLRDQGCERASMSDVGLARAAFLRAWEPAPETKRATRTLTLTDPA